MSEFAIFEFTESLLNESLFESSVRHWLLLMANDDDILFDELNHYNVPTKNYITNNSYLEDVQGYFENKINKDFHKIYSIVNETLVSNKKINPSFIDTIIDMANDLKEKFSKDHSHKYFDKIPDSLNEFIKTFEKRYSEKKNYTTTIKQIQWNAGVASLGTLFNYLINNRTEKGMNFITTKKSELLDMLLKVFVDENGNSFEQLSLQTYIYKPNKKVKSDRVPVEKILPPSSKKEE